jgi:hypothetical protein
MCTDANINADVWKHLTGTRPGSILPTAAQLLHGRISPTVTTIEDQRKVPMVPLIGMLCPHTGCYAGN